MISVERSFFERFPRLAEGRARGFSQPVVALLRRIACEERINRELAELAPLRGFAFVERVLERLQVSYRVANIDRDNIPAEGRVVVVANHPLGALDALALLHLFGGVRRDLRILANDVLAQFTQLDSLLLPVRVFGDATPGLRLRDCFRALEAEQALIVFPAGEVSRIGMQGVRDGRWSDGFVRLARRMGAPVLPVHVDAHNSASFYGASLLAKPLSSLLLAREMFVVARAQIGIRVGGLVPADEFAVGDDATSARRMRAQVYRLARGGGRLFRTQRTIAHPEPVAEVRRALRRGETLGATSDGKHIVLLESGADSAAMREIGRLRELSFRRVGEGTGARRDLDAFDPHYRHLLIWDDDALCIAGAYRLGDGRSILARRDLAGLYTATLFDYAPPAREFIGAGLELGRSFVHPAYWNSRSLDLLWQGIGAYLRCDASIRYLFGPVTMSAALPLPARELIALCHLHYFGEPELASPRRPLPVARRSRDLAEALCAGQDVRSGLVRLRRQLAASWNVQLPILLRHYVELCEPAGVRFLGFSVDPDFADATDGLIRLDLEFLKSAKRERYLDVALTPQAGNIFVGNATTVSKVS